jgi:hypothetical protein
VKQNSLPSLVEEQAAGFSNNVKGRNDVLQGKIIKIFFLYIYMVRKMQEQKNGKPYSYRINKKLYEKLV